MRDNFCSLIFYIYICTFSSKKEYTYVPCHFIKTKTKGIHVKTILKHTQLSAYKITPIDNTHDEWIQFFLRGGWKKMKKLIGYLTEHNG